MGAWVRSWERVRLREKLSLRNPLTAEVSPLTIRAHAGKIIQEIQSTQKPLALEGTDRGLTGEWVTHKGVAASCIRSHDDFRSFIDPESAPLMALWSFYIPDKSTSSDLTLVVLHGTANGNLYSHDLNELPTTRAGSQTEALFDYLWSEDLDLRGAEEDFIRSRPDRIAQGLLNMLGMEDEVATSKVEALFRVSYDKPLNPPLNTLRPNSESSTPTKSRITRLVIGSPIVVQSVRKPYGGEHC